MARISIMLFAAFMLPVLIAFVKKAVIESVCVCVCMRVCVHVGLCACVCVCVHECVCVCMCTCECVCVCVYVLVCECVCDKCKGGCPLTLHHIEAQPHLL